MSLYKARKAINPFIFGKALDLATSGLRDRGKTLVITGFWRSGTTFVLEQACRLLNGKPVFEPLYHECPPYDRLLERFLTDDRERSKLKEFFMPGEDAFDDAEFSRYLDRCLRYAYSDKWTRQCRPTLCEYDLHTSRTRRLIVENQMSVRQQVVLKMVRGALIAPGLQKRLNCPMLHVRRNPCAILASMRKTSWPNFHLQDISLAQLLDRGTNGQRAFFSTYSDIIGKYDQSGDEERLVAYWALTERFLETHAKLEIISYEDLADRPELLARSLRRLGFSITSREDETEHQSLNNSTTTSAGRQAMSPSERARSWQHELTDADIASVDRIVAEIL